MDPWIARGEFEQQVSKIPPATSGKSDGNHRMFMPPPVTPNPSLNTDVPRSVAAPRAAGRRLASIR